MSVLDKLRDLNHQLEALADEKKDALQRAHALLARVNANQVKCGDDLIIEIADLNAATDYLQSILENELEIIQMRQELLSTKDAEICALKRKNSV